MRGDTVYVVNRYYSDYSEGQGSCLCVFGDYQDAIAYARGFQIWNEEFCDPANDVWATEYFEIHVEEQTVE